jgi:hypothetical protein
MREKVNIRFLLGAYFLLLGFIIIITTVLLAMYGNLATTTKTLIDVDGHKAAIENLGTLALSFADLIKVTVGAIIGALSASLQSIMSKKLGNDDSQSSAKADVDRSDVKPKDEAEM